MNLRSLVTFMLIPFTANAAPECKIQDDTSVITFTATQNNAPVKGEFKKMNGIIHFDPADLKASNIKFEVDMNSVTTSYGLVSETLKTADWFDVKLFPKALFTANEITLKNDKYSAKGEVKIRDKTLPLTVDFSVTQTPPKLKAIGSTVIKRTWFGIGQGEWASTDEVKDDVKVDFTLECLIK